MIILLLSFLFTLTYADFNIQEGWIFLFPRNFIISIIFGIVLYHFAKKLNKTNSLRLPTIGLFVATIIAVNGLGLAEFYYGRIASFYRQTETSKTEQLERHRVELGLDTGKYLYYKSHKEEVFQLNFKYNGKSTISREEIEELARQYYKDGGYNTKSIKWEFNDSWIAKDGLKYEEVGGVIWIMGRLEDYHPNPHNYDFDIAPIRLSYRNGEITFETNEFVPKTR